MFRCFSAFLLTFCTLGIALAQPPKTRPLPVPTTHVHIAAEDRILNNGGNCGYCSFEMACRFHKIKRGYGLAAKNPATGMGGHKGCKELIKKLKLRHRYINDKKNTDFLAYWVGDKKYPVVVHGDNHLLVLVHYAPPMIKVIDNTGPGAKLVRVWSEEKFTKWWSGRAYVVLPDEK